MMCPKCKIGDLLLYKETEVAQFFRVTKSGIVYKHPVASNEFDTEKNYLECRNMECNQQYNYDTNERGIIIKESVVEL